MLRRGVPGGHHPPDRAEQPPHGRLVPHLLPQLSGEPVMVFSLFGLMEPIRDVPEQGLRLGLEPEICGVGRFQGPVGMDLSQGQILFGEGRFGDPDACRGVEERPSSTVRGC